MDDLDWLKVGERVAYVCGSDRCHVVAATVEKITKRDVIVTVDGNTERFNQAKTTSFGNATWIEKRAHSRWDPSSYLAPASDPEVLEIRAQMARNAVRKNAVQAANLFSTNPTAATAHELQAALAKFLAIRA